VKFRPRFSCFLILISHHFAGLQPAEAGPPAMKSHPALHHPVFSFEKKLLEGPLFYVDAAKGSDANPGSKDQPWKTIQHALPFLAPGDTLLLRGGTYFENVYCAVVGTKDKPITIRSYPGEVAILDGGFSEYQTNPAEAWEPGEAAGEFVSKRSHRNIRDVLGLFGDSNIGLQTYWHLEYLLASGEKTAAGNSIPFYCGPGIFYDKETGKIHIRMAPTTQDHPGFVNYSGETDPRKLPLVIAPFRSVPLHVDQAMHVRFQDLVIRGGGYNTVLMNFAVDIRFDYVTIFGGTYCIRSKNSGPVEMANCGVFGQIPPWGYWSDNALQTYDPVYYDPFTQPPEPRTARNVARLNTHALLVTEGAEESDVFFYPFNNHWKITQCEFADSHDGIYLNGRGMELSHSLLSGIQDDGFYLSSPSPVPINENIHIFDNYIAGSMTPFSGHLRGDSSGHYYIYGNIVDMRFLTQMYRPNEKFPEGRFTTGALFLVHGRGTVQGIDNILFCYNTFIVSGNQFAGGTLGRTHPDSVRNVFNNIFVYEEKLPGIPKEGSLAGQANLDGNLHWVAASDVKVPADWVQKIHESPASQENVEQWKGDPWAVHSRYGNPEFKNWELSRLDQNDYRLKESSPALDLGIAFPDQEHLRGPARGKIVGALATKDPLKVGINRRVLAGSNPEARNSD